MILRTFLSIGLVLLTACQAPRTEFENAATQRWEKYTRISQEDKPESSQLRQRQLETIRSFFAVKEKQAHDLAAQNGEIFPAQAQLFFDAGIKGDWKRMNDVYWKIRSRSYHFAGTQVDDRFTVTYWQCINECYCAYEQVASGEPKYVQKFVDDVIDSIPAGSIYFGGTDPGRFLVSTFSKSHIHADPFFTLTANALADGLYLKYLRTMYGGKIYLPTDEDSQRCFNEYIEEARQRHEDNKLKPGEHFEIIDGKVQVSGQVAVMKINGLLAKRIFDENPEKEFYIEEGFPLDWMYPHLQPHGLLMKINREPLKELSEKVLQQDRDYWRPRLAEMIGAWLNEETPVDTITEFAERVYFRKDSESFPGDVKFAQNEDSQKTFSKLRASIGGLYAWRMRNAADFAEQSRMIRAADLAFRQAYALSPKSPEAVYRYVNHLLSQNRISDALLIAKTSQKLDSENASFTSLVEQLEKIPQPK